MARHHGRLLICVASACAANQRRSSRDLPATSKFWSAYPNITGMQASGLNTGRWFLHQRAALRLRERRLELFDVPEQPAAGQLQKVEAESGVLEIELSDLRIADRE